MSRISDALLKSGGYISIAKYEREGALPEQAAQEGPGPAVNVAAAGAEAPRRPPGLEDIPVEEISEERLRRVPLIADPRGGAADRFRFLRLRLLELQKQKDRRRLLVTSPLPKDGKSTITLNTAAVMADAGKRTVLIVDADLHHAAISELTGLKGRPGLAECLMSGADPMSAVVRLEPLACYFLPAGTPVGNPTELLQSATLGGVISALAARFEWMIVDSPPVAPFTDALTLKKETDAALLVVRAGKTPGEAVENAANLLGQEHVAAIVFNAVEGLDRLYSKYYRYYSSKK